jgi:hypothetical protein
MRGRERGARSYTPVVTVMGTWRDRARILQDMDLGADIYVFKSDFFGSLL